MNNFVTKRRKQDTYNKEYPQSTTLKAKHMATTFGNTWWGSAWLKSLDHIDYENRIPRGAAYARKGMVKEIKVKGNIIKAKVAGSRLRPYNVTIIVPPFFQEEKDKLINELKKHPVIISRLLNRELAPEILDIAQGCGMKLFPSRWTDFKMMCDCPDWAVPCKHLAAVVYMLSREIDNNPFLVFEIHDTDLLGELKRTGITVEDTTHEIQVPSITTLYTPAKAKDLRKEEPVFKRIDFTGITDCTDSLLMLLPANPTFYPQGDFKDKYASEIHRLTKNANRFFTHKLLPEGVFPVEKEGVIDAETTIALSVDGTMTWNLEASHATGLTAENLPLALLRLNPDFLPDYTPSVVATHQALLMALHLTAKGCVVPQIMQLTNKSYAMQWLPATISPKVNELSDRLNDLMPDRMVQVRLTDKKRPQYPENRSKWLLSFFLNRIVKNLTANSYTDTISHLYFKGLNCAFNDVGEKETAGAIKSWNDHLRISESRYRAVFSVTEDQENLFALHIGVEDKAETSSPVIPLCEVLHNDTYNETRFNILRSFSLLSSLIKEVNGYISKGAETPILYDSQSFVPFLLDVIPAMRLLGIKVFLPKSLQSLLRPKASMRIKAKKDAAVGFGLAGLFDFDWQVAIGNDTVKVEEFKSLLHKAGGLLRFKQSYMYASPEDLKKLSEAFQKSETITPVQLFQAALLGEYESAPITLSDEARNMMHELTRQDDIPQPEGLQATLRPYQERGYSWMYRNLRIGFGSILADDMGLGKTLQAITLILKLKEESALTDKHVLIVVPTGLLTNWMAEIKRFAPSLKVQVYHGTARDLKAFKHDILLTTYGMVRSDASKLKKMNWRIMFIDEAQNVKNHDTAQSKAIHAIPADAHIALSGTPVENRLTEFWSIMDYANKGYLGTQKVFKEKYAQPIQLYNDADCAARFRKVTAPFMMRRMKSDKSIISDLPDKIEQNDYATLKREQAALYQKTLDAAMAEIEGIATSDHESLFKRQGLILQMILALKQICNHPAQYLKNGDTRPELSGKTEMLLDRVESIMDSGEKVLVFTQFREMGNMLVRFIEERTGRKPMFYHGGCNVKQRQEMIERFQKNRTDKVFILSLKAAGTGLNLTAASHVIHYDLWWNPAVEAQATDRAYRIGQEKNVMVHRFITQGTFEERIDDMIQQKKHLADMTVASGENWLGKLSNKELREIFE